jgi:DMSO/TMAO reductase YedYZ molybdopterin-dependent catalytic subunit
MLDRRQFLQGTAAILAACGRSSWVPSLAQAQSLATGAEGLPEGAVEAAVLHALPGKRPLLKRTFRPPNYETPLDVFHEAFTPNDAFFVRYHLSVIPEVQAEQWQLTVGGEAVQQPLTLTLRDLKEGFEQVEVAALCQCAGNRRGLFQPHVPGVQWGYGAMGNAVWRGVRLKEVLHKAGLQPEALELVCDGADYGVIPKTPDFVKSLPVWKALEDTTLIALAMNGAPLPHWNGYPARIVVPGWTATYWVKQLTSINVLSKPFEGFWMKTAYRIPKGKFPVVDRFISQESDTNTPITEMVVNSLITNITNGQRVQSGAAVEVKGIAWDGGYGIQRVAVSTDAGVTWRDAALGTDLGRFSWRQWTYRFQAGQPGQQTLMAQATNRLGVTQPVHLIGNPAGYHHNVVQQITLIVT